jgi:hypothetical protein
MKKRLFRAQILLDPHQKRKLEELARRDGRSISAVTRQVINAGLAVLGNEAEIWKKRSQILADIKYIREKQPSEYNGNLIDEARQERATETDQLWRGDS